MKKVLFLLVMVAAFVACSKDDDGLDVGNDEITLQSDGTYTITAKTDNPLVYTSNNEYVAKVTNDGIIKAQRIGEANIEVSDGSSSANILVKVTPKYNTYPAPFLEFGTSKSDIIAKYGTPDSETTNGIGYTNYSTKAPMLMFLFDSNNKLSATSVLVKTSYSSELGSFLAERYAPFTYSDESYTIFFVNGLTKNSITMAVGASVYNLNYWLVTYFPYIPTKSSSTKTFSFDELIKNME
ncbi:MAG: hypothetical protein EGP82_00240 [Odoribacter splanchnicus]|nr:hypothetical protein [Odoribacter splanchnicus]